MGKGHRLGLVPERAFHVERERWRERRRTQNALEATRILPDAATRAEVLRLAGVEITSPSSWAQVLRRQDVDAEQVAAALPELAGLTAQDRRIVIGMLRYDGLSRTARARARTPSPVCGTSRFHQIWIPPRFPVCRTRSRKSWCWRGHAPWPTPRRLAGVTPAALAILAGRIAHKTAAK